MQPLKIPIKNAAIRIAVHQKLTDFEKLNRLTELYHSGIISECELNTICRELGL